MREPAAILAMAHTFMRFSTERLSKPGTKSSLMEQNSGDMLADGIEARPGMKSSLMERVVSTLPDKGLADVCHDCMVGAEIVHKLH